MIKEVYVELFNFDKKTDYLPHYKRYTIEYKDDEKIIDLLNKLYAIEPFGFDDTNGCKLKINNLYLTSDELISTVVDRVGTDLIIDPVSIYRAKKDLIVDKTDFLNKIDMFKNYLTEDEKLYYARNFKLEYYASNSLNINQDYIGDHSLLIAYDIIQKNPEAKEEVLKFINDSADGIWFHTSLKHRVFNFKADQEDKIRELFTMMPQSKDFNPREEFKEKYTVSKIVQNFSGFNIASYNGSENCSFEGTILQSKANYIDISSKNEDLAPYSYVADRTFSYKIAGQILLQAKDNNADFLIVRDERDLHIFDERQSRIEKAVGREINMPIILRKQFVQLLEGEKDILKLGFDKHKIKIDFL